MTDTTTTTTEREKETSAAPAAAAGSGGPPYTKLPSGVIVDKDGKPCRACNTKSAFSAFAASATKSNPKTTATTKTPSSECPPDVEALGRSSWTLLHSIAASYPEVPDRTQQNDMVSFVRLFSKLYPCWVCAEDFQGYIAKDAPKVESRQSLGQWMCRAHNEVNVKLGKPVFDCGRWDERWRTGPKDGSCD